MSCFPVDKCLEYMGCTQTHNNQSPGEQPVDKPRGQGGQLSQGPLVRPWYLSQDHWIQPDYFPWGPKFWIQQDYYP